MKEHHRILSLIEDQPWAITKNALQSILAILERPAADLEAVAARIGRPLENTGNRVETRGDVAILGIEGPIFRYANLFTAISGATSIETLAVDLQTALDAPNIRQILLNVDSPGGQVTGVSELADQIRKANARKPVTAYVGGLGASAAYWLASAAGRVVVQKSSFTGSIGVVAAVRDTRRAQEQQGVKTYEIVSSQSPKKRPDPATDEGRAQIQQQVDDIAQLFIEQVAGFRGATADHVIAKYGQGGVLMGEAAVAAGMADAVGTLEGTIAEVSSQGKESDYMSAENDAAVAQAATDARTRVQQILQCEEATGRTELAQHLAFKTNLSADEAKEMLRAAPLAAKPAEPKRNGGLSGAMADVPNPKVGTGDNNQETTADDEAKSVLRFVPKHRKVSVA